MKIILNKNNKLHNMRYSLIYIFTALLFVTSCKNEVAPTTETEAPTEEVTVENGLISFTQAQMRNIEMKVETINNATISSELAVNGHIEIPAKNKATISSNYEGIVSKIFVEEGSRISKGQTIATITNPNFMAEQEEYLLVSSQIKMAQTEVARQQELYKGNAGPLKNLQRAQSELQSMRIKQSTLSQRLRMMGVNPSSISSGRMKNTFTITSPISGMLTHILIQVGSSISFQTPVAEVINKNDMHAVLDVFEKDEMKIYEGQQVEFSSVAMPNKIYRAHVISISPKLNDMTKALEVHCHINGDMQGLIDGSAITAKVNGPVQEGFVIPEEAIVEHEGKSIIFVEEKKEGDKLFFKMIPVTVLEKREGACLIKKDAQINEQTKLITQGAFLTLGSITNVEE